MRDETLRFLLEGSGITVEDQITLFVTNYRNIIYQYRVIQVQVLEDGKRRETAHEMVLALRDEEEEEKQNKKDFESVANQLREEIKKEESKKLQHQDDQKIQDIKEELEEIKKNIKSSDKILKTFPELINAQINVRDQIRPVTFYMEALNVQDISVQLILKYWPIVRRIERIDYKVRRFFGGVVYKSSDRFSDFASWLSKNNGSDTLEGFDSMCKGMPDYFRQKVEANVDMSKHVQSEEE